MEWHHHLEAAGLNLEGIELLDRKPDRSAADLLNNTDTVIRINHPIADVENAVAIHGGKPHRGACGNVPSLADQPGKGNEDKGFLPLGRHLTCLTSATQGVIPVPRQIGRAPMAVTSSWAVG